MCFKYSSLPSYLILMCLLPYHVFWCDVCHGLAVRSFMCAAINFIFHKSLVLLSSESPDILHIGNHNDFRFIAVQ